MLLRDILKDVKNSQYRKVITKDKLSSKTRDRNLVDINQERRSLEDKYEQALRDGDKGLAKSYSDRLEELRKEAIEAENKRDEERKNFGDAQASAVEPTNPSHIAAAKRESVAKGVAATTGKTTSDKKSKVKDKLSRLKKTLDKINDILTQDPLTGKGEKILSNMKEQYGEEKGENVFYASKNKGTISGVDKKTKDADDVFVHHVEGAYKVYADGRWVGTYQSEKEAESRADEFRNKTKDDWNNIATTTAAFMKGTKPNSWTEGEGVNKKYFVGNKEASKEEFDKVRASSKDKKTKDANISEEIIKILVEKGVDRKQADAILMKNYNDIISQISQGFLVPDIAQALFFKGTKDADPDMLRMYQQKLEDAIDSGDKEEMKRWGRELISEVMGTRDDWSPEARKAAIEARRRNAVSKEITEENAKSGNSLIERHYNMLKKQHPQQPDSVIARWASEGANLEIANRKKAKMKDIYESGQVGQPKSMAQAEDSDNFVEGQKVTYGGNNIATMTAAFMKGTKPNSWTEGEGTNKKYFVGNKEVSKEEFDKVRADASDKKTKDADEEVCKECKKNYDPDKADARDPDSFCSSKCESSYKANEAQYRHDTTKDNYAEELKRLRDQLTMAKEHGDEDKARDLEIEIADFIKETADKKTKDTTYMIQHDPHVGYDDLGYVNNWGGSTPSKLQRCKGIGHTLYYRNAGRCVTEYSCPICKIQYKIDSSD